MNTFYVSLSLSLPGLPAADAEVGWRDKGSERMDRRSREKDGRDEQPGTQRRRAEGCDVYLYISIHLLYLDVFSPLIISVYL